PFALLFRVFLRLGRPSRRSTLFPYTTLFRSDGDVEARGLGAALIDERRVIGAVGAAAHAAAHAGKVEREAVDEIAEAVALEQLRDRKSTRLNSSHVKISYAVFCLKKKSRLRT